MKFILTGLLFLFVTSFVNAQFSKKTKKLIGTWQYKSGDGFEVWSLDNDVLLGKAFRVNKLGDTSKVEDIQIKKVNKSLVYTIKSKSHINDSLIIESHNFIGTKKKMEFINIESNLPALIKYSFGCFNPNKLKISIQYGLKDEPVVLILNRSKG